MYIFRGIRVIPCQLPGEFPDLLLVEEELAVPQRIHVEPVALLVGGDVHPLDDGFAVSDPDVGFLDGNLALTDGFDLRARKHDARLIGLVHEVVVICFFVVCY